MVYENGHIPLVIGVDLRDVDADERAASERYAASCWMVFVDTGRTGPNQGALPMRLITSALSSALAVTAAFGVSPASAQSVACQDIAAILTQRKSISDRIQAAAGGGKKQIDARVACASFGSLVSNGQTLLKFVDTNKDWCQIPESFIEGIKVDHGRAVSIRGKACGVAAKQTQMEKQAREGGGNGGLLGGPGLTGQARIPSGAL